MKLLLKFNLVFLGVFVLALAACAFSLWALLQHNVKEEITGEARLLMEAAMSKRAYTSTQVAPLLEAQSKDALVPQVIPAYAATELFVGLHKRFPEYTYKEAVLNPTNPRDRAVEWEADIISAYRSGKQQPEVTGVRQTPAGDFYYVARPIRVDDTSCLECHGDPKSAPAPMLARYGTLGGFGWQHNEVVGVQVISVPMSVAQDRATKAFGAFVVAIVLAFLALAAGMNVLLYYVVIRPIGELSTLVDRLSRGDMNAPDFPVRAQDEIGTLAAAFRRLRRSLAHAFDMIDRGG